MSANTGTGIDGQFGFAEESEVAYGTIVTPDRFLEFLNDSVEDNVLSIESMGIGRGLFLRSDRTTPLFKDAAGSIVYQVMTKGFGKLFKMALGSHAITWPGSTDASQTLTFVANPTDDDTVTIGSQTYTHKTALTASTTANQVLIGADASASLDNLIAAINRGAGAGTLYGSLTPLNTDVTAAAGAGDTMDVTDKQARGAGANSVATTETYTDTGNVWGTATLASGANGTDTEYKQTITEHPLGLRGVSATAQINRPSSDGNDQPFTYSGGKVTEWKLSLSEEGLLEFEVTWFFNGRSVSTALATASFASGAKPYAYNQCALTIGGTTTIVKSFEITGSWEMDTERGGISGVASREPLAAGEWVVEGTLDAEFEDMTAHNAWHAGTQAALVMTATGGTIPSSANPYKLVATLAAIEYRGSTPTVGGPEIVRQGRPFKALSNGTDPVVKIEYHSDDAAA